MYSKILSSILKSSWAIDPRFALVHGAVVSNLLNGFEASNNENPKEKIDILPYYIPSAKIEGSMKRGYNYNEAPEGSIAVIPVVGPLMKYDEDDCGIFQAGMMTIGQRIIDADNHKNIDSIILYVDTPGGTVDGTQALADVIKNTKKPIVSYINGLMASAGYWIGSASDSIIAENTTAEIGSIGVMLSLADMEPMWEKEGVKFHRIFADQSKDKNKDFIEVLEGNYDNIKKNSLNPLADIFINAVREYRGDKISSDNEKKVFTGRVYFAKEALELGLIDKIGSLDVAIETVMSLTDTKKTLINNKTQKNIDMKKFEKLTSLLGVDNFEITSEGIHISEEMAEKIETSLVNSQKEKTASDLALGLTKVAVEEIETTLAEIDETIKSAEGIDGKLEATVKFVAELRKGAGAESASISSDKELNANKDKVKTVVKDDSNFMENLEAVKEAYL